MDKKAKTDYSYFSHLLDFATQLEKADLPARDNSGIRKALDYWDSLEHDHWERERKPGTLIFPLGADGNPNGLNAYLDLGCAFMDLLDPIAAGKVNEAERKAILDVINPIINGTIEGRKYSRQELQEMANGLELEFRIHNSRIWQAVSNLTGSLKQAALCSEYAIQPGEYS